MSISRNHLPPCLPQSGYEDESKSDDEFSDSRFNRNVSKTAQSRLRKSGNTDGSSSTKLLDYAGNGDVNQKKITPLNDFSSSSSLPTPQLPFQKSEEIDAFNNRLSSLEREREERQLHHIYQAQVAAQKVFISKHPSMRMFYVTIHSQLTGLFLGLFSLAGGLIARKNNQKGDQMAQMASTLADFGALIPEPITASVVPTLGKLLGLSIQAYVDQQQSNRMKKAANIVFDLDKGKEAAKKTAITLCELYEYQLKLLTEEGAEKLSRFACAKFLDFLTSDQLKPDLPIHEQFLMALQDNKRGITDKAKNQVARQAEKWTPTRKFFAFFEIDTEELPTHRSTKEPLYASELFAKCGIRTSEGDYYASETNKPHVYGFRVGSEDEAVELGMTCILNPDKDFMWNPNFPKVNVLHEDPILDEEIALDASKVLMEAADRYTKAEAAGLAALAEAEIAKSLILDMSAGFVDHENRIEALEANVMIRRSSLATASKNVQEGLHAFYSTEEKGVIHLAFSQRKLDIKKFFVQLALVQEEEQKEKEERFKDGRLRETLLETYETIHAVKKPIELERLFDLNHSEKNIICQKLLLLGRAGIGKSTLCQKITQLWITEGLWNNRFLYLFWIPLRNLTENRHPHGKHFLENILAGECFPPQDRERELHLVQDIREVLKHHSDQVLLILDGYDETTRMPRAIHRQLFERQDLPAHMIVTSRPYGIEAIKNKMDATLENMGFTDEHIETYISNYFGENQQANLFDFIKGRRDLMTMAHVPLLLEMLCLLWEERGKEIAGLTMVELYQAIVDYEFERYFSRQKDCAFLRQNSQLKRHAEKHRGETELSFALGKIAFEGIKQGRLLIDGRLIKEILRDFDHIGMEEIYGSGFLKATEGNDKESKPGYFMHLSIQEYFAAFYLATNRFEAEQAMVTYKYYPHMQLVWTMCAGLLGSKSFGEEREVNDEICCQRVMDFFEVLHQKPRDLIGRYHTRLAVSCLNACADRGNLYHQIEKRYKTLSTLKNFIRLYLQASELLDFSSEFQNTSAMKYCLGPIIERLDDPQEVVRVVAAEALGKIKDKAAVGPLIERLGDENRFVREAAANALGEIKDKAAVGPLIASLGDPCWVENDAAVKALGKIKDKSAVGPLIERLGDKDESAKSAAVARALGEIKDKAALYPLIERLDDRQWVVRRDAANALGKIKDKAAVSPLIKRLDDRVKEVRVAATWALGEIKDKAAIGPLIERLGDEDQWQVGPIAEASLVKIKDQAMVGLLIERLYDENVSIRRGIAKVLAKIKDHAMVGLLIERLYDENRSIRRGIARVLGEIKDKAALYPLIERLGDEDEHVREAAVNALGEIKDKAALYPLIERLGDEDEHVREAAIDALGKIKDIAAFSPLIERLGDGYVVEYAIAHILDEIKDKAAISLLIEKLGDESTMARWRAANLLGKIKDKAALYPLIERLGDEDASVRSGAAGALGEIQDKGAVGPLIERLGDEDKHVREVAARALGKIKDAAAVIPLIERLGDEDKCVRQEAAKVLVTIKDKAAIDSFIERLGDEDASVRRVAAWALGEIEDKGAVGPLIERLGDEDKHVREVAARALGKIKDRAAVEPLIKRLDDESPSVRDKAVIALGEIKDPVAVGPLIKNMINSRSRARGFHARALVEIEGIATLGLLIERLGNKGSYEVLAKELRSAAAEAIEKMEYTGFLTIVLESNQTITLTPVVKKAFLNNHPLFFRRNEQNKYDLMCGRERLLNSIDKRKKDLITNGLKKALSKELGDHKCFIL